MSAVYHHHHHRHPVLNRNLHQEECYRTMSSPTARTETYRNLLGVEPVRCLAGGNFDNVLIMMYRVVE